LATISAQMTSAPTPTKYRILDISTDRASEELKKKLSYTAKGPRKHAMSMEILLTTVKRYKMLFYCYGVIQGNWYRWQSTGHMRLLRLLIKDNQAH